MAVETTLFIVDANTVYTVVDLEGMHHLRRNVKKKLKGR